MDSLKKTKKCEQSGRTTHWTMSGKWMSISQSHVEIKNGGCNSSPLITFKHLKKPPHSPFFEGQGRQDPHPGLCKTDCKKGRHTVEIVDTWLLEPHPTTQAKPGAPRCPTQSNRIGARHKCNNLAFHGSLDGDQGHKLIPPGSKMPTNILESTES